MKLDKIYVIINPCGWMVRAEDLIITLTNKNISNFAFESNPIIAFYSDFNSALVDAIDMWDELQPALEIFNND